MIALHVHWFGAALSPPDATRFAASLAVGTTRKPVSLSVDGALFASACARPHRPIRLASGEILLFNGHIDNRIQLRRELGVNPPDDAALYAAAYAAWGDAADLRVLGDFCTIVCDPAARRARIGRAPLSGPPLHYYSDADRLIVASTPRAIFATGAVAQEVDELKIADSLFLNYFEGERGWFRNVARVPSGTRLIFTPGRMVRDVYYDPLALPPVRLASDDAYVEAANALMEEGTRAALDGFSRPAVSISGGLDSQTVAAHALRVMPSESRLLGLTSVPEQGWDGRIDVKNFGDERDHVRAFAAMHPRFDMETLDTPGLGMSHQLDAMFLLASVPPRNAMNLHWIHQVSATARARGCDVILTGAMGNMGFSFNGEGAVAGLMRKGQWGALVRELRATRDGRSLPRKLAATAFVFAPEWAWRLRSRWGGNAVDPFDGWCPLDRDYAAEMRVVERAADMGHDPLYRPPTNAMQHRVTMLGNARNETGDLMQALELLHGMPRRDPTAYRPLVEFCLSIPDDQYRRDGQSRRLARRMVRGLIPEMVANETRRGRQTADWHLRLGRERPQIRAELDRLSDDPAMARRLNLPSLKAALDNWPAETPLDSETAQRLQLALTRAVSTARFIRFVEGSNAH